MSSKTTLICCLIFLLPLFGLGQHSNDRKQLVEAVALFQQNSSDSLQRVILAVAQHVNPPLPTPVQYFELLKKAKVTLEKASYQSDFLSASNDLKSAIKLAPWKAEAFLNIAVVYEQMAPLVREINYLDEAIKNYYYYLMSNPQPDKAALAKQKIASIKKQYTSSRNHFEKVKVKIAHDLAEVNYIKNKLKTGIPSWYLYKSPTWHFAWNLAIDILYVPLVVDLEQTKESRVVNLAGMGGGAGVEFWPLYGNHIGFGGEVKGCIVPGSIQVKEGDPAEGNLTLFYYIYSLNFYSGSKSVKALLRYSSYNMNATKTGSKSTINIHSALQNYVLGLRLTARHDSRNFELYISAQDFENFRLRPNWKTMGYGLKIIWPHTGELDLEFFSNKNSFGDPMFNWKDPLKTTGLFGKLSFYYRFDVYGK